MSSFEVQRIHAFDFAKSTVLDSGGFALKTPGFPRGHFAHRKMPGPSLPTTTSPPEPVHADTFAEKNNGFCKQDDPSDLSAFPSFGPACGPFTGYPLPAPKGRCGFAGLELASIPEFVPSTPQPGPVEIASLEEQSEVVGETPAVQQSQSEGTFQPSPPKPDPLEFAPRAPRAERDAKRLVSHVATDVDLTPGAITALSSTPAFNAHTAARAHFTPAIAPPFGLLEVGENPPAFSQHSAIFQRIMSFGPICANTLLDVHSIPFEPIGGSTRPSSWGVVRISNIPFTVTRNEILAFLGRNARVLGPAQGCGVHILMDRITGKTLDCFVEFLTIADAELAVERFERARMSNRHPRIGTRHADMSLSCQEELMKELFPKVKCVEWHGQNPHVYEPTEPFNSGFNGFLSSEELVLTVKYAETPGRAPFSTKCPQRVYENFISTLFKLPWWDTVHISVATRDQTAWAAENLVRTLSYRIDKSQPTLSRQLLRELVIASLQVAAFTERQKFDIVCAAGMVGLEFTISPFAGSWSFIALGRRADFADDVVDLYATCLRKALTELYGLHLHHPFANLRAALPQDAASVSLATAAQQEFNIIVALLQEAFRI